MSAISFDEKRIELISRKKKFTIAEKKKYRKKALKEGYSGVIFYEKMIHTKKGSIKCQK